jgi:hypothetical protein
MATPSVPAGFKLVPDNTNPSGVPEARGKAAAFDAWLAQGGLLPGDEARGRGGRKVGVYTQGPMKGMTYDQAKQKFEGMWASAPDAIKEKYAGRSESDLAPSERVVTATTPAMPPSRPVNPAATVGAGRGTSIKNPAAQQNTRDLPTDERMRAEGKYNGGPTPVVKAPASAPAPTAMPNSGNASTTRSLPPGRGRVGGTSITGQQGRISSGASPSAAPTTASATGVPPMLARPEERATVATPAMLRATPPGPTGKPIMENAPKGINRLTGLPFGYVPGDSTEGMDPAMAQRANDSVARQSINYANRPQAAPRTVATPARPAKPQDDPDIIAKDNKAYSDYQKSFSGTDEEHKAAIGGQKRLYDGASSMDKARLVANTMRTQAAMVRRDEQNAVPALTPQPRSRRALVRR